MADPKDKVTFYAPAGTETSFANALTGEAESVKFKDGKFTTSDPGLIPPLLFIASQIDTITITASPRKES